MGQNNNKNLYPEDDTPSALFTHLYEIITTLRGPEGCPWDKKQTATTLRGSIIEEAYECVSAINENDDENLKEELGDLLLVVFLIVRIKEQENAFSITDVLRDISEKLIRRHPHVFGDTTIETAEEVKKSWDKIKSDVEGKKPVHSILESIPGAFPPVEKAYAIQKTVSKVGFDWKEAAPVWEKLDEEIGELKEELQKGDKEMAEEELGDILFTVVNLGRLLKMQPSAALQRTNEKFIRRFMALEKKLQDRNIDIKSAGLDVLDSVWDEVKGDG
jgi:tetrapyrrole methylase family protein / MazG family protein